ncbi:hypothetical protein ACE7GA_07990 [Roseomonas sp. CCTCC AB2023176]|uniref:hypothetical protein n=1 Tax=Roseomonas sp. CCTCC AB2023176 TaxID=3342640 RepID=UPI0035E018AA
MSATATVAAPAAERTARAGKPVAKTGDFKRALARAQAPFEVRVAAAPDRTRSPEVGPTPRASSTVVARVPDAFRDRIAALESAGAGWAARNPSSGALGRYQFVPVALQDIGWRDASGAWTERAAAHGVTSEETFLASPGAQEAAMAAYLGRTERMLAANRSLAAAGQQVTGMDGTPLTITESGLVAAAHRRGAGTVARWLEHRTRSPDAPLPEAQRTAFAQVEARVRDFATIAYAGPPRAVAGASAAVRS